MNDILTFPTETRSFKSYAEYLYSYVLSMFEWKLDFAPEWVPERILSAHGHMGVFYNGGDPVLTFGAYSGKPTRYGFGESYIGADCTGATYSGTVGEDVVVIWNNLTLSPDSSIVSAFANRYVETDKSILNVLRGARITSLIGADDNVDKATIDKVVAAIKDGENVVKIPPAFREIDALDNGLKRFEVMRITDPKDIDKLQYLSRYRDNLLAEFMNEYGIDVNVVNKGSQVSRDELHSMEKAISAVVKQRLECRKRDLDIIRSWGLSIDVKPGIGRGEDNNGTVSNSGVDEAGMDPSADNVGNNDNM